MSVSRACLQCRTSKVKCDLVRPACSRCVRRGIECSGYPIDTGFIFRDQNEAARIGSQRARGEGSEAHRSVSTSDSGRSLSAPDVQILQLSDVPDLELQSEYPWLNPQAIATLPEPLKRDLETRAVDRFFVNWTLQPKRDGLDLDIGFMHYLPLLYHDAAPGSVLWHVVRAMAFADLGRTRNGDNIPFSVKAQRSYGSALTRIREATENPQELASDHTLAALLMIDSFESIHLAQHEPLGPHAPALRYVLHARGAQQLYNRVPKSLWCFANQQLLANRLLLREDPDPIQVELLSKLDGNRPDIHIGADVLDITTLCAESKRLVQDPVWSSETVPHVEDLLRRMHDLSADMEMWTQSVTNVWRASMSDAAPITRYHETDHPLATYHCPTLLSYSDSWTAYLWTFHAASQIVLHESIIELVRHRTQVRNRDMDVSDQIFMQQDQDMIEKLSSSIIRTCPRLVGFTDDVGEHPSAPSHGMMAGRFLAIFAMTVVCEAAHTSDRHKLIASNVIQWVSKSHEVK